MFLYHGSYEKVKEIKPYEGLFGGLFASVSESTARSHGEILNTLEVDDSKVLTQYALDYECDYQSILQILKSEISSDVKDDEIDAIWAIVVEGKSNLDSEFSEERLCKIFRVSDLAEVSWDAQRIRGVIAKKLGYDAIEMDDEHGASYLVLNADKIN
jgi:hypothetical protein